MNRLMLLMLVLAFMAVGPIVASGAQESAQRRHIHRQQHVRGHNPVTTAPAASARPVAPRPSAIRDDSDGLSHEREDCNKGCIGNAR
jgi:hypothetical protein